MAGLPIFVWDPKAEETHFLKVHSLECTLQKLSENKLTRCLGKIIYTMHMENQKRNFTIFTYFFWVLHTGFISHELTLSLLF